MNGTLRLGARLKSGPGSTFAEPSTNYVVQPHATVMNAVKRPLLAALLIVALATLFAGCVSPRTDSSTIPWATPAPWEGQIPGMGTGQ